jgi:DNA-binding NarL/FixJ family response regulator
MQMGMEDERVLVCVDALPRRRWLVAALNACSGLEVVGTTGTGEAAVRMAAARQPGIVLVESDRPAIEEAKLIGRLRKVAPRAGVVAVAALADRPRTRMARALTADRYVAPGALAATLVASVRALARSRREASFPRGA